MALGPGARLGTYTITAEIGAGGMGRVYRAADTTLGRDVAIKVLPDAFADDPERLARFEREARTLASLNHPNIAVVHGFEKTDGIRALVMELVEGPTLADRIAAGAIPFDDAVGIARQVADALEAAHDHGIVHRDLKPANIKVRPDGTVKVLDFGLAKVMESAGASASGANSPSIAHSPTITSPAMTRLGVILGTAAYMAPEQAKGQNADRRSDVWAFGCVLYEMLTGHRVFDGHDVAETLASVLKSAPDYALLPASTTPQVRLLIRRCLQKDPRKRLPHLGAARLELEEALLDEKESDVPQAPRTPTMWKAAVLLLLAATLVLGARQLLRAPAEAARVAQFIVLPPPRGSFESGLGGAENWPFPTLSPDGRYLAFTGRDATRRVMLWLRPLDQADARPVLGSEGAGAPFWSPDSQSIGFFARGKLKRVDVTGGPVRDLCDSDYVARGGSWNRDGVILFGGNGGPLYRVSANGGKPVQATELAAGQSNHRVPAFFPDGRHFFFFAEGRPDVSGVYVGTLDTKDLTRLPLNTDSAVAYSPSGHVLFARQGILYYQPFDATSLTASGEPKAIAGQVAYFARMRAFSMSDKGDLAFWSDAATPDWQLTWVDRAGKSFEAVGPPGDYRGLDLARDGRVLVHRHEASGGDLYMLDSPHGPLKRVTFDASQHNSASVWSAEGSRFAYGSYRGDKWGVYVRGGATGSETRLTQSDILTVPLAWSPDSASMLFWSVQSGSSLWIVDTSGTKAPLRMRLAVSDAQFSPDGKWLAYSSIESGAQEVYLQRVDSDQTRMQVSPNGGMHPRWRHDGKELFYVDTSNRKLVSVEIDQAGSTITYGSPGELFDFGAATSSGHSGGPFHLYAVSPDGQRFLVPRPVSAQEAPAWLPITVIQNWSATLAR